MNRQEHLLTILSEECSEVIHRVSKTLRFGLDEKEPGQELTNSERIREEINHVISVISILQEENYLPKEDRTIGMIKILKKKEKVERYLKYSKELGTLS